MKKEFLTNLQSQEKWVVYLLILYPFTFGFFNELLGFPYSIRYLLDVVAIAALLFVLRYKNQYFTQKAEYKQLFIWTVSFCAYTLLLYLIQYQSIWYYLWGARNTFRFFIVFFVFVFLLTAKDIETVLCWFDWIFWLNFAVSLIQFFGFGIKQDFLGGIFGATAGVNGYTNIFFIIIIAKATVFYLENREKTWTYTAKAAAACFIASLAELKFFFVEYAIIAFLAILFTRKITRRAAWIVISGSIFLVAGEALISSLYPDFQDWLSPEWIIETATSEVGYTYLGDMNRLTAIPFINETWFETFWQKAFGLGLGNCETSSFTFLNTPFFENFVGTHYNWFQYAILYLECGWVGLVFFFGFFVLVYFKSWKIEKHSESTVRSYCTIARILSPLCCLLALYNASMRGEFGLMMYFITAIPFALDLRNNKSKANCS